jgi:hypothetical protein
MSQYHPIKQESYVPFVFQEEEVSIVRDDNMHKLLDFLVYYILPDNNPRLKIALICFASGYDVGRILNCDNTQRSISKVLNVNHRQFSNMLKNIEKEFGLNNINSDKPSDANETYKKTNKY